MKKKPLIALVMLIVVGVVGVTYAAFSSSSLFENIFKVKKFTTTVIEEFESPKDWTPGTTTSKTILTKNAGDIEVAVRVKLEGSWKDNENKDLPLKLKNGEDAAILNFADGYETYWTEKDGYYYYNSILKGNESTTTLLESVTFNENAVSSCEYKDETDEGNKALQTVYECVSMEEGYDGASYTLTITVDTLQADAVNKEWGVNIPVSGM